MGVIRQLKNFFTGKVIYPKTLTKAVYDENGERLDKILRDTMLAVDSEEYNGVEPRDADTLGGKYKADDITAIKEKVNEINSSLTVDFSNSNATSIKQLLQYVADTFFAKILYFIKDGVCLLENEYAKTGTGSYIVSFKENYVFLEAGEVSSLVFTTKNKIDITPYNTMYAIVANSYDDSRYPGSAKIGLSKENSSSTNFDTKVDIPHYLNEIKKQTLSINVSGLTGEYYIKAWVNHEYPYVGENLYIYNIWFE